MKAYKGMDKNMRCRGYQFEIGKTYEEPEAVLCKKGFHACTEPLDVFRYYEPGTSRYFEVELDGVTDQSEHAFATFQPDDSKIAAKKITIVRELTLDDIIDAQQNVKQSTIGGAGSAMRGGDGSALRGGAGSAMRGGNGSAMRGGNGSAMRGGYGSAMRGGNGSAMRGGDGSALRGGYGSVLRGGYEAKVRGGMWSVLALERWIDGKLNGVACGVVDGVTLKPDTWYHLNEIGEFEEVDDDDK